ncbi:hypothetical protein [Clostridium sporogenes]|uniref:hypothetical protein n=1 Tax=Clostridium sporogenes TaxID=1509 RepID=UPI000717AC5A|nr:hypothetical protein [Clostridium sporogenes]KRU40056.1 hypothetical protein VT94_25330 [Clostridium sporogenes]MBY7065205.1 hypothetical protein [Clostridium sporogenes]MBY7071825.1 hypothetical protein [Clostridium sporogenes]MCW6064725.1 hypothetical protein [Clostridium sporogenes]OQP88546.1 hypothetical protein VT93_0201900 [Clostridium sporogenes]
MNKLKRNDKLFTYEHNKEHSKECMTSSINKTDLKNVKVKETNDKRKTVRTPKKMYEQLTDYNVGMIKCHLISKILTIFQCAYEKNVEVLKDFGELETIPIKISNDDFKILKILKFETDATYTNIMASAISYYLDQESRCNNESKNRE